MPQVHVWFTGPSQAIPAPPGWTTHLPFQIYWDADASEYIVRGIPLDQQVPTTGNDIYVSTTGDDTGAGTALDPYGSVSHAISVAGDNDTIWIEAGLYSYNVTPAGGWDAQAINNRILTVKRWGLGDVILSHHEILSWVLDNPPYPNAYKAARGAVIYEVRDAAYPDAYGDYELLTERASALEVNNNAGSWYSDGVDVWIRLSDDRVPDSDVRPYVAGDNADITRTSVVYVENIDFHGGTQVFWAGSIDSPGPTVYVKSCVFKYSIVNGINVTGGVGYFQDCIVARNQADGFKADESLIDGGSTYAAPGLVLIDCVARHNGSGGANDQGSSVHGGTNAPDIGYAVRINVEFHRNDGQEIHDLENVESWNLNVYCHDTDAPADVNFRLSNGKMWLDRCTSEDAATDLDCRSNGAMYYRNLTSGGAFSEATGGTIEEY